MLTLTIPETEFWDDKKQEFVYVKSRTLQLEHSLVSISKWESKWHKPFLSKTAKTDAETIDYVRCMTITQNVEDSVYEYLTNGNIREVNSYIEDSMTATIFSSDESHRRTSNKSIVTAEEIYYWMIAYQIPFECQKWHLERLMTLIKVCNEKNKPAKKRTQKSLMERNHSLNESRKQAFNTRG